MNVFYPVQWSIAEKKEKKKRKAHNKKGGKGWKWYFVTIIVLTYCEKKLF